MRRIGDFFAAIGLVTIAIIVIIGVAVTVLWLVSEIGTENKLKSDFTIYMDEPIIREGGVVIIQPEAVDLEGDEFTELTTGTHKLTISSQVTIVRFQYPREGTYVYRFASANPQKFPGTTGGTKQIGVGSAGDGGPEGGEWEEIPTVLTHHFEIPGGNWTEGQSRERQANLPDGYLTTRYDCNEQRFALVCDAVDGDERR